MAMPPASMPMPAAGVGGAAAVAPEEMGPDDNVLVTICKNDDGTYTVYDGDEPEAAEMGDMSGDDTAAMGPSGDEPAGQPADSIGAALKMAMDILKADASGGDAPGNAADQFAAGFGAKPPGGQIAQKY